MSLSDSCKIYSYKQKKYVINFVIKEACKGTEGDLGRI